MKLSDLKAGQSAYIESVGGEGALRQHLLDMGMIPGAHVKLVKFAPMGDPMEVRIHGYELTIRISDAEQIEIFPAHEESGLRNGSNADAAEEAHPGLGEEGKYHEKEGETPLPEGTVLKFALVGNQNSGKTTLFNQLTGSNQHVGNFPGVTVDRKDGVIRGHSNTLITDLPGIYSMSPYSGEEIISRDFVLRDKPHAIINILDVTSIDRSMYLTMQLLELGIPMVVALNMMDEMTGNGGSVNINRMEQMLGVPVVPIAAASNQGIDELVSHAIHVAKYQEGPLRQDFCDSTENGGAVHRCLHAVIHLIEDHARNADIPVRFAASKLIEGDAIILKQLDLDQNEKETLEHIVLQMENERGLDRSAAIADMRYSFIYRVCDSCVKRPDESKEHIRSSKYDSVLTGRHTAIPVFIAVMGLVFFLTFAVIGPFLQGILENGIGALAGAAEAAMNSGNINPAIKSLVLDGVFEGVGSVLSFLPVIVTMFFFLSLLEDSGYIARVAFVMDKPLRRIGLSGRSIVPMLIGFGCTVPAVMATRTLPSSRDRRMTILLTPFMSCTAKLPIYGFFVNAFFPGNAWWIVTCLYLLGIVSGIFSALVLKKTVFKGEAVPLVIELPNYRMPSASNVGHLIWDKAKDFLQRAFSVILIATIVVWFLQSFDFGFNMVSDTRDSMLAVLAGFIAPVLAPVGLGDWRIVTALISGFMAKESVVATMNVLFGGGVATALSAVSAASMLAFSLLYAPCVAAVAAIRRELGRGWAVYVIFVQCLIAWVAALIVRIIGLML
ncbi:MAG: ferrous iron transport protein B [Mogibacterium sp.]|nr:ferrous iron transport protein B [Mogibacterium sp.]